MEACRRERAGQAPSSSFQETKLTASINPVGTGSSITGSIAASARGIVFVDPSVPHLGAALNGLDTGHAAVYTATSGNLAGATFLRANDIGEAGDDLVVRLDGATNVTQASVTTIV